MGIRAELLRNMARILKTIESDHNYDGVQVYTTGHSLGGALATIAAVDLSRAFSREVTMYNYGSPRVGCQNFATFYNQVIPKSFRVVNEGDVIVSSADEVMERCLI